MSETESPVLYSFRRCPYAMRARLGLLSSGQQFELREVVLRDKPAEMVVASPKATVPVLVLSDGTVIDESFDVMKWALGKNDPEGLLDYSDEKLDLMFELVEQSDGPFKSALDRYKYPNRYEDVSRNQQRELGAEFIRQLDALLDGQDHLFGARFSFADAAILPFVRQFAHVDRDWFWEEDWKNVIWWLEVFLESDRFKAIMHKYPQWQSGEAGIAFGA
ncbi:MAG: glutathione S-transferase [Rhizobiaceae bacterium]|nr:glutathione S-transferase [Rhizobiaceae bacterium]